MRYGAMPGDVRVDLGKLAGCRIPGVVEFLVVRRTYPLDPSRRTRAVIAVNLHFIKLANTKTEIVLFSYKNTTGYQKTMI